MLCALCMLGRDLCRGAMESEWTGSSDIDGVSVLAGQLDQHAGTLRGQAAWPTSQTETKKTMSIARAKISKLACFWGSGGAFSYGIG